MTAPVLVVHCQPRCPLGAELSSPPPPTSVIQPALSKAPLQVTVAEPVAGAPATNCSGRLLLQAAGTQTARPNMPGMEQLQRQLATLLKVDAISMPPWAQRQPPPTTILPTGQGTITALLLEASSTLVTAPLTLCRQRTLDCSKVLAQST